MNQRELILKYWVDIHNLVDTYYHKTGVKIDPLDCVKLDGVKHMFVPNFDSNHITYQFAVSIVEDKPVFQGDTLYNKITGEKYVSDGTELLQPNKWSWTPSLMLINGRAVPRPTQASLLAPDLYIGDRAFYFNTTEDRDIVAKVIQDLLEKNKC